MYLSNSEGHLHGDADTYKPLHDGIETKEARMREMDKIG